MVRKYTLKDIIEKSIETDLIKLRHYKKTLRGIRVEGRLKCRHSRNGKGLRYYQVHQEDSREIYLGKTKQRTLSVLQRKRLAEEMIKRLTNNIEAKEKFCKQYISDEVDDVIASLPLAYRPVHESDGSGSKSFPQSENPFHRENLVIRTSFGLYVRTKGELQIAELLYSLEIEFYYERALHMWEGPDGLDSRTVYPDFTIVLPDGREVYWEHKGMLSDAGYAERDIAREILYNLNGIYQPHNLIVTAEGPHNEFDMEAVKDWRTACCFL